MEVMYLEGWKTSDTVPHACLLSKMKAVGIDGEVVNWINSLWRDREQLVLVRGTISSWRKVWNGVPQGSVLGPCPLSNFCKCDIHLYTKLLASDTKVHRWMRTLHDKQALQTDLNKLKEWNLQ